MPFVSPPPPNPAGTIVWLAQPSREDIEEAEGFYGPSGTRDVTIAMRCYKRADGGLEACKALVGSQEAAGYEEAVLKLARKFRLDRAKSTPGPLVTMTVAFPKLYDTPSTLTAQPTAAEIDAVNPGGLDGQVTLLCTLTDAGVAEGCRVDQEHTHDPRLDPIALALAGRFRAKPARSHGRPVASKEAFTIATKAHTITNPAWLRKPDGDSLMAAFPSRAMQDGVSGEGRIRCDVAEDGTLVRCAVQSEAPEGYGFGTSALLLAPNFRMKPMLIDGKPVAGATVVIPIRFQSPSGGAGFYQTGGLYKVLLWAPWTKAPSGDDVAAAFPKRALAQKTFGHVALRCAVSPQGALKDCDTTSETPTGWGFGAAAKTLSHAFGMSVVDITPVLLRQVRVLVAVDFSARALQPASERFVRSVDWVRSFDAKDVVSAYPQKAVTAGVLSGRAVVACRIGASGVLESCKTRSETPEGLGFGEADLKIAAVMKANTWTQDGESTVGANIVLPLRLLYDGAEPKPPGAEAKPGG